MKKEIKFAFTLLIESVFFLSGIIIGTINPNGWKQEQKKEENIIRIEEKRKKQERAEEIEFEKRWDLSYERRKKEGRISELSEKEKEFLEEHLYGTWYFSDCLIKLGEMEEQGEQSNFSYIGREMIKYYVNIELEENEVKVRLNSLQEDTFSNTSDPYLFAIYGGFSLGENDLIYDLVYEIEEMETGRIQLDHIFYQDGYEEVEVEWMKDFIHVTYYPVDALEESRLVRHAFANDIYIDPNHTEVIYVDFCGLWKMKKNFVAWGEERD